MSGISLGTQLHAPDGYKILKADTTYLFLRSSPKIGRVSLVEFIERPSKAVVYQSLDRPTRNVTPTPIARLVCLSRPEFETAVIRGRIVRSEEQRSLPPWLLPLEGLNLACVDSLRSVPKVLHADRIERKVEMIYPLVRRFEEILDSADPDAEINRYARSLASKPNETRLRLWVYTYLAFGMNRNALHYPIHRIGHWNRFVTPSDVKRGRPHRKGKGYGYNTDQSMHERMLDGYRKHCGLGVSMSVIYVETLRHQFGCKQRKAFEGIRDYLEWYHPEGKPFPQKKNFVYHVLQSFGVSNVQMTLFGRLRARAKILPVRGAFTESVWNLMQRVESDAYAVNELPRGYVDGSALPPLYVVTRRDTASGMKTGIGFSQNSERSSAYRMAQFCEAIPKTKFCSLFGVEITEDQWPSVGLAPADVTDRGAGATKGGKSRESQLRPVTDELSVSHRGQSKAVVESSHPKTRSNDEAPSYVQSTLRSVELARKCIYELLRFNESCNVGDRIDPDIADRVSRPTPNALWKTLDELGRNDAVQISFSDAVRAYLDVAEATLTRDGVEFVGRRYQSSALESSGAFRRVPGDKGLPVEIYVLEACVRSIWLEWEGELLELEVRLPIPVGNLVRYMSLAELRDYCEFCRRRDLDHEDHRTAVDGQTRDRFKDDTGTELDTGVRTRGRPKRGTHTARLEASEAKSVAA